MSTPQGTWRTRDRLAELVGATVGGKYVLERVLGEGGMAVVFVARDLTLPRYVAVKVLRPEFHTADHAPRFHREAQSAARIDHPHCVRVLDVGITDNGMHYLVMPLLRGTELSAVLGQPMEPQRAVAIVGQILQALEHAHAIGVVHRDLKPENVFLSETSDGSDWVTILDFGIAKILEPDPDAPNVTRTGVIFGTPAYMSPEQARGDRVDTRADLYSTGLILYELLAGRHPFDADSPFALLLAQINDEPPPLPPTIGARLRRVVQRMLEKERDDRYPTAWAARRDLTAAVTHEATVPALSTTHSDRRTSPATPRDRWVAPAIAVILTLTAAIIGSTWFIVQGGRLPETPPLFDGLRSSTEAPTSSTSGARPEPTPDPVPTPAPPPVRAAVDHQTAPAEPDVPETTEPRRRPPSESAADRDEPTKPEPEPAKARRTKPKRTKKRPRRRKRAKRPTAEPPAAKPPAAPTSSDGLKPFGGGI